MPKKRRSRKKSSPLFWIIVAAVVVAAGLIGYSWWSSQTPIIVRDYKYALAEEYPALGAADAPVVIEEFSDFQCPFCGQFARTAFRNIEREFIDQNDVKVVFRYMAFIGAESNWAAEASQCAHEQGAFWEYHDMVFQRQSGENRGAFSKTNLKGFAEALGLDMEGFNQCFDSGRYVDFIKKSTDDARARGVNSTPTVFINGTKFTGNWQNFVELANAVRRALAQS